MYKVDAKGEMKAIAFREGSSGIFAGTLAGLYQGYRLGATTPYEERTTAELPGGTIALILKQEVHAPLAPRPAVHPFAGGNDPFSDLPASPRSTPPEVQSQVHAAGAVGQAAMPARESGRAGPSAELAVRIDPEASSGMFAGATGEMRITAPNYRIGGHLLLNTADGDVVMTFVESAVRGVLNAVLSLDGKRSTGLYHDAQGELTFALTLIPPNFGRGPYWGTMWLQAEPPKRSASDVPEGAGG
jgi:hypothetical protein